MNFWTVLLALALLALVFVLVPVAMSAFWHWRRPWRLTCPRAGSVAQIHVAAARASVAEVFGRRATIERCSLWPGLRGCAEECLGLPVTQQQRMRRGEAPPRSDADGAIRTILVPLDGSPGSETVLPAVAELARARNATVRLLRVAGAAAEVHGEDERIVVYAHQESARLEEEARAYLKRAAKALGGVRVEPVVRVGRVVTEIVAEAEAAGADLIALATHRRRGFGRVLKGSVARGLERMTTIPLLLIPYGEHAAA